MPPNVGPIQKGLSGEERALKLYWQAVYYELHFEARNAIRILNKRRRGRDCQQMCLKAFGRQSYKFSARLGTVAARSFAHRNHWELSVGAAYSAVRTRGAQFAPHSRRSRLSKEQKIPITQRNVEEFCEGGDVCSRQWCPGRAGFPRRSFVMKMK
jgi:hypothetical protein